MESVGSPYTVQPRSRLSLAGLMTQDKERGLRELLRAVLVVRLCLGLGWCCRLKVVVAIAQVYRAYIAKCIIACCGEATMLHESPWSGQFMRPCVESSWYKVSPGRNFTAFEHSQSLNFPSGAQLVPIALPQSAAPATRHGFPCTRRRNSLPGRLWTFGYLCNPLCTSPSPHCV